MRMLAMIPVVAFSYRRRVSAAWTFKRRSLPAGGAVRSTPDAEPQAANVLTASAACTSLCCGRWGSVILGTPGRAGRHAPGLQEVLEPNLTARHDRDVWGSSPRVEALCSEPSRTAEVGLCRLRPDETELCHAPFERR